MNIHSIKQLENIYSPHLSQVAVRRDMQEVSKINLVAYQLLTCYALQFQMPPT
jgi:hypothetical protein